jgi:hypothetical protein
LVVNPQATDGFGKIRKYANLVWLNVWYRPETGSTILGRRDDTFPIGAEGGGVDRPSVHENDTKWRSPRGPPEMGAIGRCGHKFGSVWTEGSRHDGAGVM